MNSNIFLKENINKSRILNPADFLHNCFMTSKITIQNKLKYIFSNNIIHNIDKKFFFDIGNGRINNNKDIIKYLGRYLVKMHLIRCISFILFFITTYFFLIIAILFKI